MAIDDEIGKLRLLAREARLTPEALERAISKALSRAIRRYAMQLGRAASPALGAQLKLLRQRMKVIDVRPDTKRLSIVAEALPLILMGAKDQWPRGVDYGRPRRNVARAFVARAKMGLLSTQVFAREDGAPRFPIHVQKLEIAGTLEAKALELQDEITAYYLKMLAYEIRYRGGLLAGV